EQWETILLRNVVIFLSLYLSTYLILYKSPMCSYFLRYKLNKSYPPARLVAVEVGRSARGVLIASLLEASIHELTRKGELPLISPSFLHISRNVASAAARPLLTALLLGYFYGDCHFYWTHKLLHAKPLYAAIHKYHHESFNPDPFSGLSMHAVESLIYFSSAFSLSLFVPLWMGRLMFVGQIIFPLEGHAGFGTWSREETVNHYIHHSKFEWNFGSSPLWDKLIGTDYKMKEQEERERNTSRPKDMSSTGG
ncbi:unnamed protein product, partial [Ectocarpus fasciculatus]